MRQVYSFTRQSLSANPLDGEGSFRFGGRWSSPGVRLVYSAERLELAMLEYMAFLDSGNWPDDLLVTLATVPDGVSSVELTREELPPDWAHFPATVDISHFGNRFVCEASAAVLIVPSFLLPFENILLLNPSHPDFQFIQIKFSKFFKYIELDGPPTEDTETLW